MRVGKLSRDKKELEKKVEWLEQGELIKAMRYNSETIKRVAVTEIRHFAEKLKLRLYNNSASAKIDNLIKEMEENYE
jgi:hypothetical protein